MARKSNGHPPRAIADPYHQGSLSAVQDLLGAIAAKGADVFRYNLGDYHVFMFAVRREYMPSVESTADHRKTPSRAPKADVSGSSDPPPVTLEAIVGAACDRLQVSRAELTSPSRKRSVSLARLLVAKHASKSRVASFAQVASIMNMKENSLYVGIGRHKRLPEFTMTLTQFLDTRGGPSAKLQTMLGEAWSKSSSAVPGSDADIGQRLAHALPIETM